MRSTEATTRFFHSDQTRCEEIFHGRPRPLPWPKFLVTRMLTRDLFAAVNLVYPCQGGYVFISATQKVLD